MISAISSLAMLAGLSDQALAAPQRGWAHDEGVAALSDGAEPVHKISAEDRLAIADAFARWGIAYDEGRLAAIGNLFTEDAQLSVFLASATPIAAAKGRDAILAQVSSAMAQQGDQRRHAISNIVIEPTSADTATAIAYGIVTVAGEHPSLGATVIYSSDLVRVEGVWRFSRFVIGMDVYAGTPPN